MLYMIELGFVITSWFNLEITQKIELRKLQRCTSNGPSDHNITIRDSVSLFIKCLEALPRVW